MMIFQHFICPVPPGRYLNAENTESAKFGNSGIREFGLSSLPISFALPVLALVITVV